MDDIGNGVGLGGSTVDDSQEDKWVEVLKRVRAKLEADGEVLGAGAGNGLGGSRNKVGHPLPRTIANQALFLEAFSQVGTILQACEVSKVGRTSVQRWLEGDKAFQLLFAEAQVMAGEVLIQEARRRAIEGVSEPVYQQGKLVGAVQRYSDKLLERLLIGYHPTLFKERLALDVNQAGGLHIIVGSTLHVPGSPYPAVATHDDDDPRPSHDEDSA